MNKLEYQMIDILKQLKNDYGVFEIKCEFEAEGSRMEELMRLKDITSYVGLPLIMKIGGVEAVTDMYNALAIGVKSMIAPMAETAFALGKFTNAIESFISEDNAKDIEFAFNMETITAFKNLDEMLNLPNINRIQGCTIGRVDLTGSMKYDRSKADGDEIFQICYETFKKCKAHNMKTGLGGAISTTTIPFIAKLFQEQLIDKFETRKVVFQAEAHKYGEKAILKAIEFEVNWLKSKRRYYSGIKAEDENRIEMLEKRFNV